MRKALDPKVQCLLAFYFAIVAIVVVAAASDDITRVHATLLYPRKDCKSISGLDLRTMAPSLAFGTGA